MPIQKRFHWTELIRFVKLCVKRFAMGNVSDSAIVFAYYVLLSLFPILIIIGSAIKFTNTDPQRVFSVLRPIVPSSIYDVLRPVFNNAFSGNAGGSLSIGIVLVIWSSSSSMAAFQRAVNRIYGVEKQSAFMNRLMSFVWMILLVVFLFVLMILMGFGQNLLVITKKIFHVSPTLISWLEDARIPFIIGLSFVILVMLYYFVPSLKIKLRYAVPGAILALLGLTLLSQGFSLLISYFFRGITANKTIGTFMVVILWFYFTGLVLLFGAVINASVEEFFEGHLGQKQTGIPKIIKKRLPSEKS
ncbi:YihY/virulence factor BrkB family protein [Fructilactobacillus florum]|uniref:Ribonuclease BN n=1 Tax=Fructilactobacillus florum DSM 22689 = JCM 16035 TaxID=1423745 RepID=A0A0R2CU41_9LACO|nr:YihY/virulence factor BrkB family protein [Fructilactobacillus florum]KRM91155.1 ribonuclease BN [Fructilactobacillus florum DSM 22689 = JCM 16035]